MSCRPLSEGFRIRSFTTGETSCRVEDEFSREEINYFIAYFYGYLEGRLEMLLEYGTPPDPFLHRVQSNLILYGFHEGRFFEEDFDSQEEFEKAYQVYKTEMKIEAEE